MSDIARGGVNEDSGRAADSVKRGLGARGAQCRIVPAERLAELKDDVERFREAEELNAFQERLTREAYDFRVPSPGFAVSSVIIAAAPVPPYAELVFRWRGKGIRTRSLARSRAGEKDATTATTGCLRALLDGTGFNIAPAPHLPLKFLAARSGLARYGRNNICYAQGMGSFFALAAFYSDVEGDAEPWGPAEMMGACSGCDACARKCPTGAIRRGRFLIDNERCLSYFNESPGDFPEWLPASAHNCVYDCLLCQEGCPQDREFMKRGIGPIEFDEAETEALLSGGPFDGLPPSVKDKTVFLGMNSYHEVLPRNIRALFAKEGALKE